jgi:putative Mg2+ transporter-C (MgtC) family protein
MAAPDFLLLAGNLGVSVLLGAAIGLERQWRQRMAGLRTNTLVSLGACGFVAFSMLVPQDVSPSRVAAQVVSGIGFLGAGVIFKEGANVRGLNTAATLWCSAAVGILAGIGAWSVAALLAGLVVGVNLLLRLLVPWVNRQPASAALEGPSGYRLVLVCPAREEARLRGHLLQAVSSGGLHLRRLASRDIEGSDKVEVVACLWSDAPANTVVEAIVGRLSLDPTVTAASWNNEAGSE